VTDAPSVSEGVVGMVLAAPIARDCRRDAGLRRPGAGWTRGLFSMRFWHRNAIKSALDTRRIG
jgi:hypothetical protein